MEKEGLVTASLFVTGENASSGDDAYHGESLANVIQLAEMVNNNICVGEINALKNRYPDFCYARRAKSFIQLTLH